MSAIAGIVYFDGHPIDRSLVRRMGVAGSLYGRDIAGEWFDDHAGFIYRGSTTTPDSAHEQQPYRDPESGIVVLIDGRVHARQELREACIAAGYPPRRDSDPELVLRAYQAWGEECAARILGEYGIAIWNSARRQLVCLRDPAGVRPFFYAQAPDGSFRFATVASQLLSDPVFPRQPDIAGIIDFAETRGQLDPARSPFRSVKRLPASSILIARDQVVRVERYWWFDEEIDRAIDSGQASVEACAAAFTAAIRDRVASPDPVGISLSGGYDSGSLYEVWQWLRSRGESLAAPRVFSYYWEYPEADEREVLQRLLQRWPAELTLSNLTGEDMFSGLEEHSQQLGMPEPALGWHWLRRQGAALRDNGVRTLMTGDEGNSVAQASALRIADLAKQGRLIAAFRQTKQWSLEADEPMGWILPHVSNWAVHAMFPGASSMIGRLRRRFRDPIANASYLAAAYDARGLGDTGASDKLRPVGWSQSLADVEERSGLARQLGRLFPLPSPGRDLEGVVLSTPYLDRRVVVSFLAALAAERGARPSRALPESVVRQITGNTIRCRVANIDRPVIKAVRHELAAEGNLFSASSLIELGIVDRQRLGTFLDGFSQGKSKLDWQVWTLASLEAWARSWFSNKQQINPVRP